MSETKHRVGKLRDKFILFFVILAAAPVLILGGISLSYLENSHKHDVSNLELQLIDQKIEEISKFLSDTLGILELRVGFTQKSEIEVSQQNFILENLLNDNSAFEEVAFVNLDGHEASKKNRYNFEIELYNISKLDRFSLTKEGSNFIGEIYYTLDGPFVTMGAPVKNRNNEIIQILIAEVNLSEIKKSIERAGLGKEGYLVLLDKTGLVIAYKNFDNSRLGYDLGTTERISGLINGEEFNGLGERDRYYSLLTGEAVAGAGRKIAETDWLLLVEWPIRDADKIILSIRNNVVRLTLISIFGVVIFALFFASWLVKPIRALEAGTLEIEKGNFEKRVEVVTGDELEELGHSFNKMAQGLKRLQELKNEFVFIAAHELRTPLAAIKGFLSLLKDESEPFLSKTSQKYVSRAIGAGDRLAKIVDDVLEIARSESGRIKIEVSVQDMAESIKIILAEIKLIADQKNIKINYDELPELPKVMADPAKLKEVITNFISNAIKYNNEGGRVRVCHELTEKEVITHIEDNGFGISEAEQKHLFEKFFRAEVGKIKSIEGTGLGLFITKELVEKMGGRVWFKSKEAKGTKFSFSLKRS